MNTRLPLLTDIFLRFLKLGLIAFGGPLAHIAFFRDEFVERRRWLSQEQFAQLLAICQCLPGPASSQLGFAIGLYRGGWAGALLAFIGFTLPSVILLCLFSQLLPLLTNDTGQALLHGLKLVACVIVADAVVSMSKQLCPDITRRLLAGTALLLFILLGASGWPLVVAFALAILVGLLQRNTASSSFVLEGFDYSKKLALAFLLMFLLLLIGLPLLASDSPTLPSILDAFYRAGALVFGGGHVVLPLLENAVVNVGWVSQTDFVAGYGAAQAVPGPLFSFSAYLGSLIPSAYPASVTALLALLALFLPGFLLLAACLPFWQTLSRYPAITNALAGINAAVVGLLAATLIDPILSSAMLSPVDILISVVAFISFRLWRYSPLFVVIGCVAAKIGVSVFV